MDTKIFYNQKDLDRVIDKHIAIQHKELYTFEMQVTHLEFEKDKIFLAGASLDGLQAQPIRQTKIDINDILRYRLLGEWRTIKPITKPQVQCYMVALDSGGE